MFLAEIYKHLIISQSTIVTFLFYSLVHRLVDFKIRR